MERCSKLTIAFPVWNSDHLIGNENKQIRHILEMITNWRWRNHLQILNYTVNPTAEAVMNCNNIVKLFVEIISRNLEYYEELLLRYFAFKEIYKHNLAKRRIEISELQILQKLKSLRNFPKKEKIINSYNRNKMHSNGSLQSAKKVPFFLCSFLKNEETKCLKIERD